MKVIDRVKLLHPKTEVQICYKLGYVLIFRGYADEVMNNDNLSNLELDEKDWDIVDGVHCFDVYGYGEGGRI